MLNNELALSENIFEGKYFIEYELINEYEMEMALNKQLRQLKQNDEDVSQKYRKINRIKMNDGIKRAEYKYGDQQNNDDDDQ